MTGARCPVCGDVDLAVTLRAASCNRCGYCWPVEQLALPLGVEHRPSTATAAGSPLVALRERSARTRWLASEDGDVA